MKFVKNTKKSSSPLISFQTDGWFIWTSRFSSMLLKYCTLLLGFQQFLVFWYELAVVISIFDLREYPAFPSHCVFCSMREPKTFSCIYFSFQIVKHLSWLNVKRLSTLLRQMVENQQGAAQVTRLVKNSRKKNCYFCAKKKTTNLSNWSFSLSNTI